MQKIWKQTAASVFGAFLVMCNPYEVMAEGAFGPALASGEYFVEVQSGTADITDAESGGNVLAQASEGTTYEVVKELSADCVKVMVGEHEGYIQIEEMVNIREASEGEEAADDAAAEQIREAICMARRQSVVDYALQFVGCPYQYGGKNPNTGVDCSGFTGYVLRNSLGIQLGSSSVVQAGQGTEVSREEMERGDLIFYSEGGGINHVALYIGDGQIVHASTYETGVKISSWDYRAPVKIMNVIGD